MADSSQKFIARNRAPRVQIEYDVELYGAEKKVQLPFVMGVMSDLAGKSEVAQPSVADRKFLEIDVDNFDERMKGLAPRAVFTVPNTLTGEGSLAVDLTFEKMSDFTPGAIAARVDALQPLLLARQQLSTLMAYMDGKSGAEALIERILADPALLSAVAAQPTAEGGDIAAALETLRQITPAVPEAETTEDVLAGLRSAPTVDHTEPGRSAVLEGLRGQAQPEQSEEDQTADVLAQLSAAAPEDDPGDAAARAAVLQDLAQSAPADHDADSGQAATAAALDSLAAVSVADTPKEAVTGAVLAQLAETSPGDAPPEDQADEVLAAIERREEEAEVPDGQQAALDSLAAQMPQPEETAEDLDAVLGSLSAAEPAALEEAAQVADVLATIPDAPAPDAPEEDIGSILDTLPEVPAAEDADEVADRALGSLAAAVPADDDAAEAEDLEDVLQGLQAAEDTEDTGADALDDILSDLAAEAPTEEPPQEDLDSLRDSLAPSEDADATEEADLAELLGDLAETEADAAGDEDDLAAVLAGLESTGAAEPEIDIASDDAAALSDAAELSDPDELAEEDVDPDLPDDPDDDAGEDLDSLLMDLDLAADADDAGEVDAGDDLDALLGALDSEDEAEEADPSEDSDDLNDLDALLGDLAVADEAEEDSAGDDLDDLLSSLDLESGDEDAAEDGAESDADDLAALLGDLDAAGEDLDDLLGDGDEADAELDLDSLLNGLGDVEDAGSAADAEDATTDPVSEPAQPQDPEYAYGRISAARPEPQKLQRKRFRLAILGDFSGRSARGEIAIGADLAGRAARQLDVDTVEELIEGFATELVLPIGRDGDGIAVPLGGLDDLHPDELYENVALFAELVGLRKQLQSGATADHALRSLTAWGEKHGTRVRPPKLRSAGNAVPADRRLSAFQQLIGDSGNRLGRASPIEDLLAQVVGPHVRAAPSADVAACQAAVDAALSDAMRLVLHHPEFQMVEAQWRSLDLIARSIETDDTLDVMLYDISAEEMAADLAASDDLADSGLVRLLTEAPLDEENGRGGYSALIGLYQFEETPPHAELLGRIARVAAHVDAPFFAAMSAAFMDSAPEDLLPQVRNAWATLRDMPEAGHLALLSPRFLLRRPYGAKSDPIYAFDFEEFSESEGLRGMLWGNPAVLAAILLAQSFRKNGPGMGLGQVMSLGGMPYHYVNDRYGDQVALPCTERNINLDKIERAQGRGFAAVSAVKGRDELRLTSFNSLQGREILGPWTGQPVPAPSPPDPRSASTGGDSDVDAETDDLDLDDLDLEADSDLDDLLAGFDDDDAADDDADSDDMDDELAALLDDL